MRTLAALTAGAGALVLVALVSVFVPLVTLSASAPSAAAPTSDGSTRDYEAASDRGAATNESAQAAEGRPRSIEARALQSRLQAAITTKLTATTPTRAHALADHMLAYKTASWYDAVVSYNVKGNTAGIRTPLSSAADPAAERICSAAAGFAFDPENAGLRLNRVEILNEAGQTLIRATNTGDTASSAKSCILAGH